MTIIKPEDDPGVFTFELLNDETKLVETLTINVIEVVTILNMDGVVAEEGQLPLPALVAAIRRCGRPVRVVEKLEDHVLIAKFAAASLKLDQLGKEPRSSLSSPPPTESSLSRPVSQRTNMSQV